MKNRGPVIELEPHEVVSRTLHQNTLRESTPFSLSGTINLGHEFSGIFTLHGLVMQGGQKMYAEGFAQLTHETKSGLSIAKIPQFILEKSDTFTNVHLVEIEGLFGEEILRNHPELDEPFTLISVKNPLEQEKNETNTIRITRNYGLEEDVNGEYLYHYGIGIGSGASLVGEGEVWINARSFDAKKILWTLSIPHQESGEIKISIEAHLLEKEPKVHIHDFQGSYAQFSLHDIADIILKKR